MTDTPGADDSLPVDPPVHVERYPDHLSVAWQAGTLAAFLRAVRERVPPDAPAVVGATDTAGRERRVVASVEPRSAIRYVRVEPTTGPTLAWERRTTPVVTLTGRPDAATCRALHLATTACEGWSAAAQRRARAVLGT